MSPMHRPVNILLVDDRPQNLDVLESILDAPGYRLIRALNANEALEAIMAHDLAAIVLDVMMPDMNGFELARLVRARKKTENIPILFLTAHLQEDQDVLTGYGVGAVDYLTKPVNPQILRSKVGVFADLFRKTQGLVERTEELQTANQELEAFSYSVAHDLRGPLRSINAFSHLLLEDYASKLDETAQSYLRRIHKSTLQMEQLITDLLALARVARATMQPTSVDLSGMAQRLAAQLQRSPHVGKSG